MRPRPAPARPLASALHAVQCAGTLVVVLGILGLIACLAGIASPADLPWILGGAFMGSFLVAAYKHGHGGL